MTRVAVPDTDERDVRHVGQVADRTMRRHFRQAIVLEQRDQLVDDVGPHAGMPVRVVVDRGRDDRARFRRTERRADANGVAHQDVARQRTLLRGRHDHVAQRTDARVDAIRANAARDDCVDEFARRDDTLARLISQRERRAGRHRRDLPPVERPGRTEYGHGGLSSRHGHDGSTRTGGSVRSTGRRTVRQASRPHRPRPDAGTSRDSTRAARSPFRA